MRRWGTFAAALLAVTQISAARQAPEEVHRLASGPSTMCGVTGRNVQDLMAQALESPTLQVVPIETPRFTLFANANNSYQLVFTAPTEPAYPAASCRHTYERDGTVMMERSLRCEAGRAECDALYVEFRELDAQVTRLLRGED